MKKVIIIDDEPAIRKLLADYLTDEGWDVTTCSSGDCYITSSKDIDFDLVITDLVMEKITGTELIRKYLPKNQKTIVISGFIQVVLANELYQTPNVRFLQKPFCSCHLQKEINELFNTSNKVEYNLI